MANINHLAMAAAIAANPNISVKKGFLGLTTSVTYQPTNSPVSIVTTEFTQDNGSRMSQLIGMPVSRLKDELAAKGVPQDTAVGPVLMEALVSRDRRFAAIQLFRYAGSDREPLTELRIAEGDDATVLARLAKV